MSDSIPRGLLRAASAIAVLGVLATPALASAGDATPGPLPTSTLMLVLGMALVLAKLAGGLAERFGQPSVVGELTAGILIGPSVLGRFTAVHLDPSLPSIHLLAEVGVVLLLFEVGLETDLKALLRSGGRATLVAIVGVCGPMALGFLAVRAFIAAGWVTAPPGAATLLGIFIGATLTATSVGITARVLQDLGRLHGPEARILLGAAVIDDIIGLAILSAVTAIGAAVATGGSMAESFHPLSLGLKLGLATAFLALAVALGRYVAPRFFNIVAKLRARGTLLVTSVGFALLLAWATERVGLAMILGGFAAGLILSETNQFDLIEERVKTVSDVLTPLFFLVVGANVDVAFLDVSDPAKRRVILLVAVLLVVAITGKLLSGLAAPGRPLARLVVGIGMVPRGEVGLIFAQAGLHLTLNTASGPVPLLSRDLYSALTLVVLLTTFVAPPLLRVAFARLPEDR